MTQTGRCYTTLEQKTGIRSRTTGTKRLWSRCTALYVLAALSVSIISAGSPWRLDIWNIGCRRRSRSHMLKTKQNMTHRPSYYGTLLLLIHCVQKIVQQTHGDNFVNSRLILIFFTAKKRSKFPIKGILPPYPYSVLPHYIAKVRRSNLW